MSLHSSPRTDNVRVGDDASSGTAVMGSIADQLLHYKRKSFAFESSVALYQAVIREYTESSNGAGVLTPTPSGMSIVTGTSSGTEGSDTGAMTAEYQVLAYDLRRAMNTVLGDNLKRRGTEGPATTTVTTSVHYLPWKSDHLAQAMRAGDFSALYSIIDGVHSSAPATAQITTRSFSPDHASAPTVDMRPQSKSLLEGEVNLLQECLHLQKPIAGGRIMWLPLFSSGTRVDSSFHVGGGEGTGASSAAPVTSQLIAVVRVERSPVLSPGLQLPFDKSSNEEGLWESLIFSTHEQAAAVGLLNLFSVRLSTLVTCTEAHRAVHGASKSILTLQNDKKALFEDNIQAKAQASLAQQALTSGADILSALRSSRHGWEAR